MEKDTLIKKAEKERVSIVLVFKEYLHSIILYYLFKTGLFDTLVFQGGTAIRFFYKGVRYSEDLDFVVKNKYQKIPKVIGEKIQDLCSFIESTSILINKCDIKIQRENEFVRRFIIISEINDFDIKDKTRIEICNVPSYKNKVEFFKSEYLPLYPAVTIEMVEEILIDKIVAFGGREYLKGRDIWDIYFLNENYKVKLNENDRKLIKNKINDYGLEFEEFRLKFNKNLFILKNEGEKVLFNEMERFLPFEYRKFFANNYSEICKNVFNFLRNFIK